VEPPALTDFPFAAVARLIQSERAHSYFIRRSASNHPNIFVELRKVHDRWRGFREDSLRDSLSASRTLRYPASGEVRKGAV
jgi:hypothetical protein